MATKLADVTLSNVSYEQYKVEAQDWLNKIAKAYLIAHGATEKDAEANKSKQAEKYKRYDPTNKTRAIDITDKNKISLGEVLLLPISAPAPSASGSFALTSERNVRSKTEKKDGNIIYTAKADPATKFKYSSLYTDPGGLVWAQVDLTAPNNKDKDNPGTVLTKGWICVKSGADYYTDPHLDPPKPDLG